MEFKYRVGVENESEHIDFWDYEQNELDLAKARFDEIKIAKGQRKYLLDLETDEEIETKEKNYISQSKRQYFYDLIEKVADKSKMLWLDLRFDRNGKPYVYDLENCCKMGFKKAVGQVYEGACDLQSLGLSSREEKQFYLLCEKILNIAPKTMQYVVAVKDLESCIGEWYYTAEELQQAIEKYESIDLKKGERKYLKDLTSRLYLMEKEIEKDIRYQVFIQKGNTLIDEWFYSEEELEQAKERYELTELEQGENKAIRDLKNDKIILGEIKMKQLMASDLARLLAKLIKKGEDLEKIPVYIGDDDELNGIHTAWYCQNVEENKKEDEFYIEMINDDSCNVQFEKRAILIS